MRDKIFICYRREDTAAFAALLRERLVDSFGDHRVFVDIDSISPGIDFVESINEAIAASAVVLVLIGRRWTPERLQDPRDFVRIEIETALKQGARIVPLLFEDVNMPRPEELPPELASLTRRQAVEIGTSRLNIEIRTFVEDVERIFKPDVQKREPPRPTTPPPMPAAEPRPTPPPLPRITPPQSFLPPSGSPQKRSDRPASGMGWALLAGAGLLGLVVIAVVITLVWRQLKALDRSTVERPFVSGSGGEAAPKANRIGINYRSRAFSEKYLREKGLPDLGIGLEVTKVFPGSPAEQSGVTKGDIIRKANGRILRSNSFLDEEIDKLQVGEKLMLEVWRGSRAMDVTVPVENALKLYEPSCSAGVAEGCLALAAYYLDEGKNPAKATDLFRQLCESGSAEGCSELGFLLEQGEALPKDLGQAAALYQKSCSSGNGYGCYLAAILHENGEGVEKDPARAAALYERACSLAERSGCSNLGRLYENGSGVLKDESRAVLLYGQACDEGDSAGCNDLGRLTYLGRGVPKDVNQAVAHYKVACNAGNQIACVNLGAMYEVVPEVEQDLQRAATLYEQACGADVGIGCTYLARLYESGKGKDKDLVRALELFQKGCDLNYWEACNSAGYLHAYANAKDSRVPKDVPKAMRLFQHACEKGIFLACNNLGVHYQFGDGTEKDAARGAALYQQACEGGASIGCRNLGSLYEEGLGVTRDLQKASELYRQACTKGDSEACSRLEKIAT